MHIIPASAIVATRDRPVALERTLHSLSAQCVLPFELIVIDGSADGASRNIVERFAARWAPESRVVWRAAGQVGAASQRNQGMELASQPFVWFFDDDILFEPNCVQRLWLALQSDFELGGVSAMIVNQRYRTPGAVSQLVFTILHGRSEASFAGRVIGPGVNLLPEDRDDLLAVVHAEWLNSTCALYRRPALPTPPFDSVFTGYSMMEDLTLSLRVGRKWRLANARTARIFHDSQPSGNKADASAMSAMELVNRHYVMTEILGRRRWSDYCRLLIWEGFQLTVCALRTESRSQLRAVWRGKLSGAMQIGRLCSNPRPDRAAGLAAND